VLELPAPDAGVIVKIIKQRRDGGRRRSHRPDRHRRPRLLPPPRAAKPRGPGAPHRHPPPQRPPMPAARKIMDEKGIAAADVQGSGRGGRILKEDVSGAAGPRHPPGSGRRAPAPTSAAKPALPQPNVINADAIIADRPEQRVPMTRLRARVAERLVQSQSTNAILTTFNEVNMAPVMEMRKKYQDEFEKEHGVKLGFMSFFVKAAVAALKKFPVINASVDGNDIVYHGYFDIGIAVGSPRGLVVPILRDADQMSLAQIEKKIAEFGQKAKDGKLSIEDLTGGTFSISNGGVFGSMLSTPIINPPQSAILGVHATKDSAVVENGQVVIRPINYLALSYDHRIIDGREAVLGPRHHEGSAGRSGPPAARRLRIEASTSLALKLPRLRKIQWPTRIRCRRDRRRPRRLRRGHPCRAARPVHGLHRVGILCRPEGRSAPRRHLPQRRLHSVQGAAAVVRALRGSPARLRHARHLGAGRQDRRGDHDQAQGQHRHPAHRRHQGPVQEEQGHAAARPRQVRRPRGRPLARSTSMARSSKPPTSSSPPVPRRATCRASRSTTRSSATTPAPCPSTPRPSASA
jgi:2-oxoglutarate dehydrogenase E2 component (dihydrolipoamide succinyltransferase)